MFCTECGKKYAEGAKFCGECGAKVEGVGDNSSGGGGGTGGRAVENVSEKSFVATLVLCVLLGGLGVHRFYVGKIGTGVMMLLTLGGLGIWTLIDVINIAIQKFTDGDGAVIKA